MCISPSRVHDLLAAQQEAGELADMSARAGRRLQTDIINQLLTSGRSNKMADGSVGAKMATWARMTKKMSAPETHALLMPIFPTSFGEQWVDSGTGESKKFNL